MKSNDRKTLLTAVAVSSLLAAGVGALVGKTMLSSPPKEALAVEAKEDHAGEKPHVGMSAERIAADGIQVLALARSVRAVRDGEAALRAATARLEVLDSKVVPQAQTAVDLARGGFEAGKFSLLEVLDAQAALTTARTELIAARLDRAKALAALERAAAQ